MRFLWILLSACVLALLAWSLRGQLGPEAAVPSQGGSGPQERVQLTPLAASPASSQAAASSSPSPDRSAGSSAPAGVAAGARTALAVEQRSAVLALSVVGRLDRKPLACDVELWRLDDPAQDSAVLFGSLQVPAQGLRVAEVPEGRYRAHVHARTRASDDPPAFEVKAPQTELALEVQRPLLYAVRFQVRDERGELVRMGISSSGFHGVAAAPAAFGATAPAPVAPPPFDYGMRHLSLEPGEESFHLGVARDLDCTQGGTPWFDLRPKSRTPVRIELAGHEVFFSDDALHEDAELLLLGVSLPSDWFDAALQLPGGKLARAAGARIDVRCAAVVLPAPDASAYKRVPVSVAVELAGYQPLQFEYRLEEGAPPTRVLTPR